MFVWGSCNAGLLDEIFKVQKRCVRIVLDALFLARTLLNQICIYTKSVERSHLKTERSNLEPYSISSLKKRIKMQRAKTYAKIGLSRCKRSNLSAIFTFSSAAMHCGTFQIARSPGKQSLSFSSPTWLVSKS